MFNENDKKEFINYFIIGIISQSIIIILVLSLVGGFVKENEEKYIKKVRNRPRDFTCEVLRKDYLYVVTEDIFNKDINYYKIDNNYDLYEARSFEYEIIRKFHTSNCFYYDRNEYNEIISHFSLERCKVSSDDDIEIEINEDILNIIDFMFNKYQKCNWWNIVILNDEYYVLTEESGNHSTLYHLLKYKNNNILKLASFDNEEVISLKSIN